MICQNRSLNDLFSKNAFVSYVPLFFALFFIKKGKRKESWCIFLFFIYNIFKRAGYLLFFCFLFVPRSLLYLLFCPLCFNSTVLFHCLLESSITFAVSSSSTLSHLLPLQFSSRRRFVCFRYVLTMFSIIFNHHYLLEQH